MRTGVPAIDDSPATFVVGSDEAGYGAWAGRLYVAATAVPRAWTPLHGLTDSKNVTERKRAHLNDQFRRLVECDRQFQFCVRFAENDEIDSVGVWSVLHRLHRECVKAMIQHVRETWATEPLVVVDGNLKLGIEGAISLPKADALVPAVSMASVLAKVARDETMVRAAALYPVYAFESNKGYKGDHRHPEALVRHGMCPIHRRSYEPMASMVEAAENPSIESMIEGLDMEESSGR